MKRLKLIKNAATCKETELRNDGVGIHIDLCLFDSKAHALLCTWLPLKHFLPLKSVLNYCREIASYHTQEENQQFMWFFVLGQTHQVLAMNLRFWVYVIIFVSSESGESYFYYSSKGLVIE